MHVKEYIDFVRYEYVIGFTFSSKLIILSSISI